MKCAAFVRAVARAVFVVVGAAVLWAPLASPSVAGDAVLPEDEVQVAENSIPKAAAQGSNLRTRFVVGLDRKVDYHVFSLSNPNRVVVEMGDAKLALPELGEGATGLVKSFRGGLAAPGKMRIVLDVTQPVVVDTAKIEKSASGELQLALDIMPVDAALKRMKKGAILPPSALGATGLQPPLPKPAQSPKQRAAKAYKPVIVLDPGHGGMDSGAAKNGTVEKHVVLAFAHALRELLEESGRYKVIMTRSDDTFIELDERRAMAERNSANLFIAVHADYAGKRARGATIFSLRDRVARNLKSSATRLSPGELSAARRADADASAVTGILSDLAERDVERTQDRTDAFTKTVIENMSESTTMRNEPDQQAAFRVLKTAQFPSVLIELAYVSNYEDAKNLKSDEWRYKVAESIANAVDNYFSNDVAHLPF